jgi:hypothetical protein
MNLLLILKTPWRSARPAVRWVMCGFFVLCLIPAVIILIFNKGRAEAISDALGALGFGTVYVWAFFLSHTLLLAMDARDLRIPRLSRTIVQSLLLYGGLCVAVPTVVLGLLLGNAMAIAVVMGLCVLGGLLFAWLPRYFAAPIGLLPAVMIGVRRMVDIPGPSQPEFMSWALPLLLVVAVLTVYRWRQLLRTSGLLEQGMRSPMVMQFRRFGESSWGTFGTAFSKESLSQQPAWMLAKADLRDVGPQAPLRAMRVALGGFYMPKDWRSKLLPLAQYGFVLLALVIVAVMTGLESKSGFYPALTHVALPLVSMGATYGTALISIITIARFSQRWRKTNTELPLLALMPGLGDAAKAKRDVLCVSLSLPVRWQIGLTAAMIAAALLLHVDAAIIACVVLAQLCCVALLPAVLLRVISGRPLKDWVLAVGTLVMVVLLNGNTVLPVLAKDSKLQSGVDHVASAIAAVWVVAGLLIFYVGRIGWRALQHRPHAFLANRR